MAAAVTRCSSRLLLRALTVAAAALLTAAPAALASSATSVNWAGYVAHRAEVRFRSATAEWRVPVPSCAAGSPASSAVWVGLGGFTENSDALEQTGVEIDCSDSGQAEYFAWYELLPAPPHVVSLGVEPGDLIRATVSASGHRVTIILADLSDRRTFRQAFYPSQVDTTSADWIVEAPSECNGLGRCFGLPLADFGRAGILGARAVTRGGRGGAIASRRWNTTAITLVPYSSRFFADTADTSAEAIPSALFAGGTAFTVTYQHSPQLAGTPGETGPFISHRLES